MHCHGGDQLNVDAPETRNSTQWTEPAVVRLNQSSYSTSNTREISLIIYLPARKNIAHEQAATRAGKAGRAHRGS
jgi:hypothetical protein